MICCCSLVCVEYCISFYSLCVVVVVTFVQVSHNLKFCSENDYSQVEAFEAAGRPRKSPRDQAANCKASRNSMHQLKVKGHDSTITNRLEKHGWFWFPGEKKIAARLRFAKLKTRLLEQIMRAKRRRLSTTQSRRFGG